MTPQAAAKELESVMRRVREAQSTIAAAIEPGTTVWRAPLLFPSLSLSRVDAVTGRDTDAAATSRPYSRHGEALAQSLQEVPPVPLALPIALQDAQETIPLQTQATAQGAHGLPQFSRRPQEALSLQRQKAQSKSLQVCFECAEPEINLFNSFNHVIKSSSGKLKLIFCCYFSTSLWVLF